MSIVYPLFHNIPPGEHGLISLNFISKFVFCESRLTEAVERKSCYEDSRVKETIAKRIKVSFEAGLSYYIRVNL